MSDNFLGKILPSINGFLSVVILSSIVFFWFYNDQDGGFLLIAENVNEQSITFSIHDLTKNSTKIGNIHITTLKTFGGYESIEFILSPSSLTSGGFPCLIEISTRVVGSDNEPISERHLQFSEDASCTIGNEDGKCVVLLNPQDMGKSFSISAKLDGDRKEETDISGEQVIIKISSMDDTYVFKKHGWQCPDEIESDSNSEFCVSLDSTTSMMNGFFQILLEKPTNNYLLLGLIFFSVIFVEFAFDSVWGETQSLSFPKVLGISGGVFCILFGLVVLYIDPSIKYLGANLWLFGIVCFLGFFLVHKFFQAIKYFSAFRCGFIDVFYIRLVREVGPVEKRSMNGNKK